jgi:hypothetical protein
VTDCIRIIGRAELGLKPATRVATRVDPHPGMVAHCTAGSRPATLEQAIAKWRITQLSHQRERGWSDVGYGYCVTPWAVLEGRGFGLIGAHAKGHNRYLGVVFQGHGLEITEAEKGGFLMLREMHLARGGGAPVVPHCDVSRVKPHCPGPAPTAWIRETFEAP